MLTLEVTVEDGKTILIALSGMKRGWWTDE
jgi:hypothetical protein